MADNETTGRMKASRTNLAIAHFLLNGPKWSLSLFLFLATRSVQLQTPHDGIEVPIRRLQDITAAEARSYQSCAIDAFRRSQFELKETSKQEFSRVSMLQETNQASIRMAEADVDSCARSAQSEIDLLVGWLDENNDLPNNILTNDTEVCSFEDRGKLESLLGGKVRKVEDELSFAFGGFIAESKRSLQLIGMYATKRFDYDFRYFVTDRIQPAVRLIGTENFTESKLFSIDHVALEQEMRKNFDQVEGILDNAALQMRAMALSIEVLSSAVENFYLGYLTLYSRLAEGTTFAHDVLPPGAPIPEFLDMSDVPVAESLLPTSGHFPVHELNSIEAVLENSTQSCLNVLDAAIQELTRQSGRQLRASYHELSSTLSAILDFNDYSPPRFEGSADNVYSISDEIEFLQRRGQTTLETAELAFGKLEVARDSEGGGKFEEVTSQPTDFFLAGDVSVFGYLQARLPSVSFPETLLVFLSWVIANTWIIEVVVQAARLWRLETFYSNGTIPDLPEIEYRETNKDPVEPTVMVLVAKTLLSSCAAPTYILLILLSPFLLCVFMVWQPYIESSCEGSGVGTFVATNFLAPLLINEASIPGNALFLEGELQCRQVQQTLCTQQELQLSRQHNLDLAAIWALQEAQNESRHVLHLTRNCIQEDVLAQINESCCGLKSNSAACPGRLHTSNCPINFSDGPAASFSPVASTSENACNRFFSLEEARFDCTTMLEACADAPCSGVNAELLSSAVVESDCAVEKYLVNSCIFFLVVLYHGTAISIGCTLLSTGVRQVFWRKLYVSGFVIQTRVREDGSLVRGYEQAERAERVARAVTKLKISGNIQLLLGAFLLLLWVGPVSGFGAVPGVCN